MSSMYAVDATHFSLVQSLKNSIRKIKREKQRGLEELRRSHYLQGTFAKLCDREHFQELVFPGFSREAKRGLPKTLVELFEWEELQLDLDSIAESAATVFKNIKIKGAKQGQIMDSETEKVLLPQIAQEALAKRILEEVQKLNRKVSSMIANSIKPIAAPTDERVERDLLDEEVGIRLRISGFTAQPSFMGPDWIPVIRKDLIRYVRDEKLSLIDANGVPVGDIRVEEHPYQRISWLEQDDDLKETYPALYEVVDYLQGLAFELNAKGLCPELTLLEPGKGCTLLTIHPVGSEQKPRLDTRQNVEGFDSGIRVTVCYNIHLQIENSTRDCVQKEVLHSSEEYDEDDGMVRGFGNILFLQEPEKRFEDDDEDSSESAAVKSRSARSQSQVLHITRIPVVDDLLTLHRSANIRNGRTREYWSVEEGKTAEIDGDNDNDEESTERRRPRTAGVVWATIHHFICGRDVPLTSAPLAALSRQLSSISASDLAQNSSDSK